MSFSGDKINCADAVRTFWLLMFWEAGGRFVRVLSPELLLNIIE
ncbi:hypothetical protein Dthio_PD2117 [Desulfonatronospira thiodismutans ASO3-1]|uniref:Uncharacterized protein n=1 Tax=Desulfonatronospira thiodismutans ASO3-1 TaxID=555779 RepID=D6SPR8_9BACT|nr:hypothetical protein Dthio_PD2117 [Desulfonatronospira thiodismutans ASO3-1]